MTALRIASLFTASASGIVGGALFAFSSFVMPGLRRLDPHEAVTAMQAINLAAPRGVGLPIVVSGLGGVAVGGWALAASGVPTAAKVVLGAAAVTGAAAFAITAGFHIPLNDRLAAGSIGWDDYVPGWVAMNHVRTALSVLASGLAIAGAAKL